jgi:hypothetical protein
VSERDNETTKAEPMNFDSPRECEDGNDHKGGHAIDPSGSDQWLR